MSETTRNNMIDSIQSSQYKFPYHYIPSVDGFPNFSKRWAFSASYIAAINLISDWIKDIPYLDTHRHIDFGCGDGGFINALSKLVDMSKMELEGIDFDENAIRWAKLFSVFPENFTAGDIRNLKPDTYDTGTLIEVFEHIPPNDAGWFIESIARALKKNGLLLVTVPSIEVPVSAKHYRHFNFETLKECFVDFFEVEDIFGFEKRSFLQKFITKLTNNRYWMFESRLTNKFLISQFSSKHKSLSGCGRIAMLLRKK